MLACAVLASAPAAAVAQTDLETDTEARGLFEAGRAAFGHARYDEALQYFRRSYELSHRPDLLFNIGQTADRMRRDAEALDAFTRYLDTVPDAANRAEVETRVRYLREALSHDAPATPIEPESVATTPEPGPTPDTAGDVAASEPAASEPAATPPPAASADPTPWVLVGTGAALAIASIVMLGVSASDLGAVTTPHVEETFPAANARQDQGEVLLGVGVAGAVLATGLVIVGIVLASGSAHGSDVAVRLGPTGLALTGTF